MKKLLMVLCVSLVAGVGASQAAASGHPEHYARGNVTLSNPTQHLKFGVIDRHVNDRGYVTYSNPSADVSYTAHPFCVNVDSQANAANFAYTIPTGSLAGTIVVWHVTDGGAGSTNDTAGFSVAPDMATATTWCQSGFTPTNTYTITGGNIYVH